ncbi:MAG: hypothetical protein ACREQO_09405, partial [Candidatus Binatia bacterium]
MKLSLKSMILAGAAFKLIVFIVISLLNLLLRPFGGAYLIMLAVQSLSPLAGNQSPPGKTDYTAVIKANSP